MATEITRLLLLPDRSCRILLFQPWIDHCQIPIYYCFYINDITWRRAALGDALADGRDNPFPYNEVI